MTNIVIDRAIEHLQSSGGISTMWAALRPLIEASLPQYTFDASLPADVFVSTYYQPAPSGAKSIAVVYDYIATRFPGISKFTLDNEWKYAAVNAADDIIAISQWTANDVKRFQGRDATVIHLATALIRANHSDVLAFRRKYNLPDTYVLIVGRRDLYKNVSTYWQAMKLMDGVYTVCIGGETLTHTPTPAMQIRLNLDELSAAYTGALCLVYPSLYEGFGLPVIEAYACGCPVICGSGGGLAEINEAALVVDVTRPREIAEAVIAMHDHSVRIEHIMKGFDTVTRFSWGKTAREFAGVIARVAERVEA
jgi:glycosyltransferase involved in cell wall biosynthesis